jgi:NADH:ubiquinone oxidoreductase subunit E
VKPWTCMGNCQEGPMICVIDDVGREHFISKGNLEELEQMVGGHGN